MVAKGQLKPLVKLLDALQPEPAPTDGKGRTRARILRTATELFQRLGYRATSIDEVARLAGVGKGTVYLHFRSKSELLFHAIVEEKAQFIEPFRALFEEELEPADRLRRYLAMALAAISRAPLSARLASGDREMFVFIEELPEDMRRQLEANQIEGISALLEGVGAFSELPAAEREKRRKAFSGLLMNMVPLMDERARGGLEVEEYAWQIARILVDGVGAP